MLNAGNVYKILEDCAGDFWSAKRILTYNRPVNVVTASRSVGKSTGVAVFALADFLKNGHKFFYVRRRQRDTQKTAKTFFNNAVQIINMKTEYNILGFRAYRGQYEIALSEKDGKMEWTPCGCYLALSEEEDYKSSVFSDYTLIIYDEFISKDPNKYLGTRETPEREWEAVTSLYQTIDRGVGKPFRNETRIFLLGNKSTIYNPICLSLGICDYVMEGARFTAPKSKTWVWEDLNFVVATQGVEESFAYQMSTDRTRDYAYRNLGKDTKHFIRHPKIARYVNTVRLRGVTYGIMVDDDFRYYIGSPQPGYHVISLDTESHDGSDLYLIQSWRESPTMMMVAEAYKRGKLFFVNGKIQSAFLKYLQFVP